MIHFDLLKPSSAKCYANSLSFHSGFEYISYPLMTPPSESPEPQAAVLPTDKSLAALAELLVPKGDTEAEFESPPPDSTRVTPSNQDGE